MYEIGSIADIISGLKSHHEKTLEVLEVQPEKIIEETHVDDIGKEPDKPKNAPDFKSKKSLKKLKPQKNKNKNDPNQTGPFKLKRKANDDSADTSEPKKQRKEEVFDPNQKSTNALKRLKIKKILTENPIRDSKTIFVGNVPLNTKKSELIKFFTAYGPVHTLRFRGVPVSDPKIPKHVALIKKTFHPNRKSLQCYVVFENTADAQKALEANGKEFEGHHLRVDMCQSADPDQQKAIFIGNLPFEAEDDDVWKLFKDCGHIFSVRIIRDQDTQIGKGFGYVNFDGTDAVELALQMENVRMGKRVLRISRCSGAGKNTKRNPIGKKVSRILRERDSIPIQKIDKAEQKSEFQGSKFTDKKKKKKANKTEMKMKKMSKILTA